MKMEFAFLQVKMRILRKMIRWNKWGASHTENVLNGLPGHLIGAKITKQVMKELVTNEWLIPQIKTGEVHYSLNPRKRDEILEFYFSNL